MKYTFHIVDVFSSTPFGGNQLAVLPDAAGISTEGMQKIAREFNFRETTFVLPKNSRRHRSKLRGHRPLIARDNKCCEHCFQRGFWQGRSLELRRRERRMPAARCLRKIPVPSCVSIAIPPGLQPIAFHNPSSFKEEKCL